MKSSLTTLFIALLWSVSIDTVACHGNNATWNILSLDGGGIRGLITATVVKYMEEYSYNYSVSQYCLPERAIKKVSMSELYDMVAGTSTGSLLATAIVFPNPDPQNITKNKFFADDAIDVYTNEASVVFTKYDLGDWGILWGTLVFTLVGSLLGLLIGH
jgi:predicted acylesterase/phospholipase RssA